MNVVPPEPPADIDTRKVENDPAYLRLTNDEKLTLNELDYIEKEARKKKLSLIESVKKLDNPKRVTKDFFAQKKDNRKLWQRFKKTKGMSERGVIEPLFLLMRNDGYTDPIQGVKAGEFKITSSKGDKKIFLMPEKMTKIKIGDTYYSGWIGHEDCAYTYPMTPHYDAEMYEKTTQKLAMNWRDKDADNMITARTKMYLYIIGAIVIGLVLLFSTDFGSELLKSFSKDNVATATEVIKTAGKNISMSKPTAIQ